MLPIYARVLEGAKLSIASPYTSVLAALFAARTHLFPPYSNYSSYPTIRDLYLSLFFFMLFSFIPLPAYSFFLFLFFAQLLLIYLFTFLFPDNSYLPITAYQWLSSTEKENDVISVGVTYLESRFRLKLNIFR